MGDRGRTLLAKFTIVFQQKMMLILLGQRVLNVDYLYEPSGTLLVSIALGSWVASMGLLIAMITMYLFSALGDTWFPLEAARGAFAALGKMTPSAWAMNGFQNILIHGLGLESIGTSVLIPGAFAILFFILAIWRFRKIET